MAVQAQYPSNVLFLNSVQEGKNSIGNDYSILQPQPGGGTAGGGGGFLDQSQMMLFSSNQGGGGGGVGINNPRKRVRETTTPTINSQMNNNPFSIQSQSHHPNLIDLTHFHTPHQPQPQPQPQPNVVVVSTGLRLSFGEQQQQLRLQQQQRQSLSPQSSSVLLASDDLAAQIRQHKHEIDQFLQSQGEELRRTLAEKRQRHYRTLLCAAEEAVARRLREKEAEAEKAVRRNSELEARAARLFAEAQVWQARARAQETAAAALQAQLQQAVMCGGVGCASPREEELGGEAEDAESAYVDPERVTVASGPSCKVCGKRAATVVVLPCRHLCLCSECGSLAQSCPLCLSFRESSVEVFFS